MFVHLVAFDELESISFPLVASMPIERAYPEMGAGGFTAIDGTVEFYGRVNAVLQPGNRVLDFGAGRGAWFDDDPCRFRRELRLIKGKCREVIGADIDPAIKGNKSVDQIVHLPAGSPLPFQSESFDLIIADFVFEHLDDPGGVASEFSRILLPGGWICARTPNRWGYISILTRMIRNSNHVRILRKAQPERRERDVFPTRFRLNTKSAVARHFPGVQFENFSYYYQPEPAYHFNSSAILALMRLVDWAIPGSMRSNLFVFLRKRSELRSPQT